MSSKYKHLEDVEPFYTNWEHVNLAAEGLELEFSRPEVKLAWTLLVLKEYLRIENYNILNGHTYEDPIDY